MSFWLTCCGCCWPEEATEEEREPLVPSGSRNSTQSIHGQTIASANAQAEREREKRSFKQVIDDAQRKFLATSNHRRQGSQEDVVNMKKKLQQVKIANGSISPPPVVKDVARRKGVDLNVVEVLSQPVVLAQNIDAALDDVAAVLLSLVATDGLAIDESQSALVQLKPVSNNNVIS